MRFAVLKAGGLLLQRAGGRSTRAHPWLLGVSTASAVCVAYLIAVGFSWSDVADRSLYANLGMIPIGMAATIVARGAALSQTGSRASWAWRLIGASFACFCGADILFFVYQNVLGRSPFPSLADAGYLVYYPLMLAGLLLLPRRPSGSHRWWRLAGYAALLLGGGLCVLEFLLLPTLSGDGGGTLVYVLSLGYPMGDLLLLAGVAATVARAAGGRCLTILLLAAGVCVGLSADIVFGYQNVQGTSQPGGLSDALYMGSWLLYAWAAYTQATGPPLAPQGCARSEHAV